MRVGDGQMVMLRPLLEITRNEILGYARHRGLQWMEDESNLDAKYDRNFLRHRVLPKLGERFPGYRAALLRVSRHAAEATALLDELASDDAASVFHDGYLRIERLRRLSSMRARNLLRWHLDKLGIPMPSAAHLEEILRQVTQAHADAQLRVSIGTHEIRRYRDRLYVLPLLVEPPREFRMDWNFQDELVLPGGRLRFESCRGQGISLSKLKEGRCEVRSRSGKDTLRPDCRRPARSLKNLLQEAGVPPWERSGLPLLYCGGRLVWGQWIGVDCAFQAMPDEDGVLAIYL
jgi:tRNA(Ile)-lysidine synthase